MKFFTTDNYIAFLQKLRCFFKTKKISIEEEIRLNDKKFYHDNSIDFKDIRIDNFVRDKDTDFESSLKELYNRLSSEIEIREDNDNTLQSQMADNDNTLQNQITSTKSLLQNQITSTENTLQSQIIGLQTSINTEIGNRETAVSNLESQIDSAVNNAISSIVAEAPENLDTLKEMSDWIASHQEDATQINSEITSIKNNLTNKQLDSEDTIFFKLMKLIYPIGSLYWSSNSTNPSELFGGTWEQITDRFIFAAGVKEINSLGGEETHTLKEEEMPSHYHSVNSMETYRDGLHNHALEVYVGGKTSISNVYGGSVIASNQEADVDSEKRYKTFYGGQEYDYVSTEGNHSHTVPLHNTNNTGNNQPHNNMPPYIVKYCWERVS